MGTYLNKPVTDKVSQDMENDRVLCGASSMQGWREAQEDSHNCILNFDRKISLFAVYDGHGGPEVAQYASSKLPSMVKNKFYKNREFEKALKMAYLDFDDSLLEPSVVDELTALREDFHEGDTMREDHEEEDNEEELNELYEEAKMPLEEIIMKYKNEILKKIDSIDKNDQPGSSKESSNSSSQSSSSTSDKEKNNTRGSTKVNGTPKNDEQKKVENLVAETSKDECGGPSSSNEQNGSGVKRKSGVNYFVDDSDESEDSDDEIFEVPHRSVNQINNDSEEERYDSDSESDLDLELDSDSDSGDSGDEDNDNILYNADFDDDDEEKAGKDSGCTAVMALLIKRKLFVANAGDSRCVVSVNGKAHDMSKDHKPEDELELKRICAAGGRVSSDGRVNGGLNLSRALGDHNYKKNKDLPNTDQMITALPDLSFLDLKTVNADFIVLACDGIWNSLSSQEVVDFISERINKPNVKLSSICEELFDKCLAPNTLSDGTGCDNMTCIIVTLKPKKKRSHSVEGNTSGEGNKSKKLRTEPEVSHEREPRPIHEPEPEPLHVPEPAPEPVHVPEPVHEPEIRRVPKPDLILETEAALHSALQSSAARNIAAAQHSSEAVSESEAVQESDSVH